jgi:hypothetical protein
VGNTLAITAEELRPQKRKVPMADTSSQPRDEYCCRFAVDSAKRHNAHN